MKKITITSVMIFLVVTFSGCSSQKQLIYYTRPMQSSHFTNPEGISLRKDAVEGVVLFTNKRCTANLNLNCLVQFAKGDMAPYKNGYTSDNSFHVSWAYFTIFF